MQPGQFIEFETKLYTRFLIAEPSQRRLKLGYLSNGNRVGVNAWIGPMNVEFGSEWKGKREVVSFEVTWPYGNLKATGKTVNGIKHGEWNYFNEQGDRIKIEFLGTGEGTSICDPEYPKNKGAGIRRMEIRRGRIERKRRTSDVHAYRDSHRWLPPNSSQRRIRCRNLTGLGICWKDSLVASDVSTTVSVPGWETTDVSIDLNWVVRFVPLTICFVTGCGLLLISIKRGRAA